MAPALSLEHNGGNGFRFQMGEWKEEPNYILQTKSTLKYFNMPPEFVAIYNAEAVQIETVRHFALGPEGKWYFEHVDQGKLICNHSSNYLEGVDIDWKNGPIHHIEYGAGKTVWGMQKKQTTSLKTIMFSAHLPADFQEMLQIRLRQGVIQDYNTDIRFAAFGKNGQWVFGGLRRLDWSGNLNPKILERVSARDKSCGIQNVELSPLDAADSFIEYIDRSTCFVPDGVWALGPLVTAEKALTEVQKKRPGRVSRNYEEDAKTAAKGLKVVRKMIGLGGFFGS